jgi:hypothetical protein
MGYSSRITALVIIELLIAGCGEAKKPLGDSGGVPGKQVVARASIRPDPAAVIALAKTYHFAESLLPAVPFSKPIDKTGKNKGVPKSQDPRLTFARAETVSGTTYPKDQEVLLLIHAEHAYPGLKIAQGNNYVWRDKSDTDHSKWTVWLISEHPADTVELTRGTYAYSSADPSKPHLVVEEFQVDSTTSTGAKLVTDMIAYGACIDDDICQPSGHCGYSQ